MRLRRQLKSRGSTLVETLMVVAILGILSAILLPALGRAREAARRSSCQNNLKQFSVIYKMYTNESAGGFYPPTQRWHLNGTPTLLGFRGLALYPDYWTDPNLILCPSDSRAKEYVAQFDHDYGRAIETAARAGATPRCLDAFLSLNISYAYIGYATRSSSQLNDVIRSRFRIANYEGISGNAVFASAADMQAQGCPRNQFVAYGTLGETDIPADPLLQDGFGQPDDDGRQLPGGYRRLREGVERFLITDLNSPAATASAQSEIPTMFDVWTADTPVLGGRARFNHIPGGSNVLYMDGHVQFIRLGSAFPVANAPRGTYGQELAFTMASVAGSN